MCYHWLSYSHQYSCRPRHIRRQRISQDALGNQNTCASRVNLMSQQLRFLNQDEILREEKKKKKRRRRHKKPFDSNGSHNMTTPIGNLGTNKASCKRKCLLLGGNYQCSRLFLPLCGTMKLFYASLSLST